jgi:hypothetical protein
VVSESLQEERTEGRIASKVAGTICRGSSLCRSERADLKRWLRRRWTLKERGGSASPSGVFLSFIDQLQGELEA